MSSAASVAAGICGARKAWLAAMPVFFVLALGGCVSSEEAWQRKPFATEQFGRIPVMEDGELISMKVFARQTLKQFSGRSSIGRKPAIDWLGAVLFDPGSVRGEKVFLVKHRETRALLGLVPSQRRVSFGELEPVLSRLVVLTGSIPSEENGRTPLEQDLLRLRANAIRYMALTHAFEFCRPTGAFSSMSAQNVQLLNLSDDPSEWTFLEGLSALPRIRLAVEDFGTNLNDMTDDEQELLQLAVEILSMIRVYRNGVLAGVPVRMTGEEVWLTPFDALMLSDMDIVLAGAVNALADMSGAYLNGEQDKFDAAVEQFLVITDVASGSEVKRISYRDQRLLLDFLKRAERLYAFSFAA
jgi:hypothetical protein